MKKLQTQLILIGMFMSSSVFSQTGGQISGNVTDKSQKNIEAATVSLLKIKDSSIIKTEISNKEGKFQFSGISQGTFLISLSAVGHKTYFSNPFTLISADYNFSLGTIQLQEDSRDLKAVVVISRKPFIEQKIDKMVINVDAAVTNVGSTALEVLEKSPGITVDRDGNISLKGKQQVLVMMDGRPTYLGHAELTNLLKSMPASSIDQIEIMTNPPAKYDAAGNSGVINIKTKKNKQAGFNGSVTLSYGQGRYWKTNDNFNLNYRTGKFNFFANGSYNKWNGFQELDILRKFKNAGSKELNAIFEQTSHMRSISDNYTLKIGADYYLTKKTTLGFVTTGFINPETFTSKNTSYLKNPEAITDSIVYATSSNESRWKNGSVNLNIRHEFDSTGRELTADLDYITYKATSAQSFVNTTYNPDWMQQHEEILRGDLPVNIDIYSAKIDYAQTIGKGVKFETGWKSSYVETDNSAFYYNIYDSGESVDYSKTNRFLYKENINAVYVNFNKQFKKVGVQTGMRYENTNYKGKQYGNPQRPDSSFSKSYGSLFPTVFISYKASEKHQWGINYGRRIDRPAYQDLNPFMFFLDNYTYQSGNPFIRPQFSDNVELSHTFKGILTTTLNYSYTKDFQTETFEQEKLPNGEEGYATIVRQGNIGKRQNAGIAVSAQVPVNKWWTAILYTNLNYNKFSGEVNNELVNVEAFNLLVNINNQFKFEKGWSAELSGWYRTKGVEGQIILEPFGQVSAGVSKQIIKGKATVKLSVRDIFYTQQVEGNINFNNTEAYFKNRRDSRVANISFVYRFGKQVNGTQSRKKSGGASDEQNRVKVGNNG